MEIEIIAPEKRIQEPEILKEKYEKKKKKFQAKIFALEYEKRELEYQVAIANEQKIFINTKQKNDNAEISELKAKYEGIVKSNASLKKQIMEMQKQFDEEKSKLEEELSKKAMQLKPLIEENKKTKKKYSMVLTDKNELEEIVIQQEQKVNELQKELIQMKETIEKKDIMLKESQENMEQMNIVIENQKKSLVSLPKKTKGPISPPINSLNLQNQIKALRKENEQKDNKISVLQMNNKILNSKISKAVPFNSVRSNNSNNNNGNCSNNNLMQHIQQNKYNQQQEVERALSALENKKIKRLTKPKSKDKIPQTVNQNKNFVNFYESDPVYCEPSIQLDNEINDFLKKPVNDYKVLQPSQIDLRESKSKNQNENRNNIDNENEKEIQLEPQLEFPIIESYSILKSQSEMFDKDDSKVEELQVMVKKILDDF